jgi:hypothetical protein
MIRSPRWLLIILLWSPLCLAGDVRTWTDKQGQTTRAEFVRIHEGRVVLKSGTKTLLVPLSQLSTQDQDYLEQQLNRKTLGGKDDDKPPTRFWTDTKGNQTAASYVRMNDTMVVLAEGSRPRTIDFAELSQKDQDYIKDLLRKEGQEELVASLEKHVEDVARAAEAARQAAAPAAPSFTPPMMSGPSFAPSPAYSPPANDFAERMRQQAEERRQADEARRQADEQRRQEAQQRYAEEQQRRRQEEAERQQRYQEQREEQNQRMQERMANMMASTTGPTMVTEYRCSKCNGVVPDSVGAGGNCPHCGVYFEYSQSPTGQKTYASGSSSDSSGSSSYRIKGRAIRGIIFLVILVCGGAAALWRKINGE